MNRKVGRRYLPVVMMASTLAMASACHSTADTSTASGGLTPAPSSSPASVAPTTAPSLTGALTLSDGTADVTIGKSALTFSSAATDASWSSDGSRIAYVDGDGNIATAGRDGTEVVVLTKTDTSVKRAQPVWIAGETEIAFSERGKDGVWRVQAVQSGTPVLGAAPWPEDGPASQMAGHDQAPTSAYVPQAGTDQGVDLLAFEHDAKTGAQVWIVDFNQREPDAAFLITGADPALSPDGKSLAYVGKGGQLYVTPVAKASKSSSKQVSFGVKGITHPVWSPDGSRIAYATATDVESISAKLAPGVATNAPTVESTKPAVPSYVSTATDSVARLTGADPIADSIALSKRTWNLANATLNTPSQSFLSPPSQVTLISENDPTALQHVSGFNGGPVLFTDGTTLDPRTATEIKRALGKRSYAGQELTVQIYGGSAVMSAAIQTSAKALGYTVTRIPATIPPLQGGFPVLVASDTDQAVLANLNALNQTFTTILVHGSALTTAQEALIRSDHGQPVWVAGDAAASALQASWPNKPAMKITNLPAAPADESVALAQRNRSQVVLVAAGDWKAMVLANLAATPVIVLGSDGSLSPAALTWLNENGPTITTVYAFGATSAVSAATQTAAAAAASGPAGSSPASS